MDTAAFGYGVPHVPPLAPRPMVNHSTAQLAYLADSYLDKLEGKAMTTFLWFTELISISFGGVLTAQNAPLWHGLWDNFYAMNRQYNYYYL
jgi:hypothetical protein